MDDKEAKDRFLLLVEEYRVAAWIGLGKIRDPGGEGAERNLKLARHAIDTLGMLEHKTRGNLAADEERYLRQAVTDLRMNYLDELKSEESGTVAAAADGEGSSTRTGTPAREGAGGQGSQEPNPPEDPDTADPATAPAQDSSSPGGA